MAKRIKSQLKKLRLELAVRRGDTVSIREVSRSTGIAVSTLRHLEEGDVKGVDFVTITKLAEFYGASRIDDLLQMVDERLARLLTVGQHDINSRAGIEVAGTAPTLPALHP
jgi:DNA-binding Xre family transcriptional regulator